ncbi:MAG: FecR family protein [Chitinophagaceae bacterium]
MDERAKKINILLLDNRFVDWILNPQSPYMEYWLQWIEASIENTGLAEEAKQFLLELRTGENESEKELDGALTVQMWTHIEHTIEQEAVFVQNRPRRQKIYWLAAAVVVGLILFSAVILFLKPGDTSIAVSSAMKEKSAAEVIRYNGSEKNQLFFLPDGSKITLAKGARISYSRLMSGKKRQVQLTGEAYFDVVKNPEKPFYIYTPKLVIKVLGTSFRVSTVENKESVAVRTGKVSVYLKDQDLEQSAPKILLPHQISTYLAAKKELITATYTGALKIELEVANAPNLDFEDAPLDTVFKTLEIMYAVPVHYNANTFKNCYISISLSSESLEEKLEVITKTIGASFTINDYGINIEGKGCMNQ